MKKKDKYHLGGDKAFEFRYDPTVYKNTSKEKGALFSPQKAKDRLTTYKKVNDTDH